MIKAGIDVGSRTTKVVLIKDSDVISRAISSTGWKPAETAETTFNESMKDAGIKKSDISKITVTGYGRIMLAFADKALTEITCHARGAFYSDPGIRTVVDIGGQDSKVIRIAPSGYVEDFAMNDRCAAGTGKFLEFLAHTLDIEVSEFGELSLGSESPSTISSMCTVFAESEIISLLAEKIKIPDIIAGIHSAIARRIEGLIQSVGYDDIIAITGGVAKNPGIKIKLEELLNTKIAIPEHPEFIGALGAALS
ncbi:MAG: 2-hydroxyglutaryl-CoA dehydratase [bacterium]|nr:2-hydroxyglutaryl-CoA dehydratase [bacterium]